MNKNEKSQIVKVLEKLARLEERINLGFRNTKEDLIEIKKSVVIINEEMGALEDRVGHVENLYFQAKAYYEKMSMYWKVISFVLSPIVTFLVILGVKIILGLPIP